MTVRRSVSIANDSSQLSSVRGLVKDLLETSPFDSTWRNKIVVAVDEALANVVEHAYEGDRGEIQILLELDHSRLQVVIRDSGVKFNPGDRLQSEIDIHEHIRKGLKGGLGMFLMQQIMDEVRFTQDAQHCVNELVMVKRLPPPEPQSQSESE
ncbi:MAG: ATP-binding protein [Planctomycetes bacterium]|nr:ATP-binding protein [Planctomycetota bacterium]